ncbi:hypothetical protein K501DRAFT_226080 [Backusella circina FSU 941]|nr:hypothetical protein K501DRAFT_226080 [Backusella circina FSU 941]
MDAIRYTIYYTLWAIERSMPYIDDFLFDIVTVRLPNAITHAEHWWVESGKPASIRFKDNMNQHVVPATIHAVEVSAIGLYQASSYFYQCTLDLIQVWKRFIDRHDWERLANDLCEMYYKMVWRPVTFIVTKTARLCQITYQGCMSAYHSIKQDIVWLVDIAIPSIYNYVISTRIAHVIHSGLTLIAEYATLIAVYVRDYLLSPTLGRLLKWMVKGIDQLILILQEHRFQERCLQIYRFLAPGVSWLCLQSYQLAQGVSSIIQMVFDQMILPSYRLFTKHVVPRLAIAYQRLSNRLYGLYISYVYPAWERVYPLIQLPLIWLYKHLSGPIFTLSQLCYKQMLLAIDTGAWTFSKLASLSRQCLAWSTGYMGQLYQYMISWLEKQAPILSKLIQESWERVYNQDWQHVASEFWAIAMPVYDWTNKQGALVYASLERSLTSWATEQGASFDDDKISHKKVD